MKQQVEYIQAKSILSALRVTDNMFGIGYNMNLYRGCQHGCIYCDTRSECYGIGDISRIRAKINAPELLHRELSRKRRKKATIGTGSMNDPYMPVEANERLTRRAMEIIAAYHFPVHVITKSGLVVRDTDLLQEISATYAAVSFTITTYHDDQAKKIEPFASSPALRFGAMEQLAKKGIYTGVTLMPLLPFINDTIENLESIMKQAKDSGAHYVFPMFGVTMRKGSRDYFYEALDHSFPGMKQRYQQSFGNEYICNSPAYSRLFDHFMNLKEKLSLDMNIRFYTPSFPEQLSLF